MFVAEKTYLPQLVLFQSFSLSLSLCINSISPVSSTCTKEQETPAETKSARTNTRTSEHPQHGHLQKEEPLGSASRNRPKLFSLLSVGTACTMFKPTSPLLGGLLWYVLPVVPSPCRHSEAKLPCCKPPHHRSARRYRSHTA